MKKIPLHTTKSLCKTLFSRYGKMGWENFLGRMIGGGWDSQPTSIMEVYETEDTAGDEDGVCGDTAGAVLRHDLPDLADPQGSGAGGGVT